MTGFQQRDIISIRHFNKKELLYILDLAQRMEQTDPADILPWDFIDIGISRDFLAAEFNNIIVGQ